MRVELSWNDEIVRDGCFVLHLKCIGRACVLRCTAFEWLINSICIALYCVVWALYCVVFLRRTAFYCICNANGLSIRYLVEKVEFN